LQALYAFYGEYVGLRIARKHISWYSKGQNGSGAFRQAVNRVDTIDGQLELTSAFFEQLESSVSIAA